MTAERARALTLAATALGSALAFIDTTVVVVALPTIRRDLGLGLSGQQWVYLAYALSLSALYLVSGAVGDRVGLRRTFVAGTVLFAAASAACGLAPTEGVIVAARAAQGVGGALLTTNSLALLRVSYGRDAGRAIGMWTSLTSLATVIGPPAGGAVVEWASWRWIFAINIPLAAVVVALALAGRCDERRAEQPRGLDVPGAAFAAIGLSAVVYALVQGAEHGFGSVWWAAVVAVAAIPAFALRTARAPSPLVPPALFRETNLTAANVVTLLVYAALGAFLVFTPVYLQFLGFSAFESGLALAPTSLVLALLAPRFGGLADRAGPRRFIAGGAALIGSGLGVMLAVGSRGAVWSVGVAGLALFALGLAALVAPITATAIGAAPSSLAGVASGLNQTVARVGSLLAVAAVGLVITVVYEHSVSAGTPFDPVAGGSRERDASVTAFRAGMGLAAGLAFAGALVAGTRVRDGQRIAPSSRRSASFRSSPPP